MQQDSRFAPINIDKYIALYNKGLPLSAIKPLHNQTYRIFKESKEDIRIIDKKLVYEDYEGFSRIQYFVKDLDYFYMVPVKTINETIVGFILRGVIKGSYSDISREFTDKKYKVPLMFGFNKSFKDLNIKEKAEPIIICEGSKDCLALKSFYPYVLANKTSSMGINLHILRNLTDKFILLYDNDKAGNEGIRKDVAMLKKSGALVQAINISDYSFQKTLDLSANYKDIADMYCNRYGELNTKDFDKLKNRINLIIKSLYDNGFIYNEKPYTEAEFNKRLKELIKN